MAEFQHLFNDAALVLVVFVGLKSLGVIEVIGGGDITCDEVVVEAATESNQQGIRRFGFEELTRAVPPLFEEWPVGVSAEK